MFSLERSTGKATSFFSGERIFALTQGTRKFRDIKERKIALTTFDDDKKEDIKVLWDGGKRWREFLAQDIFFSGRRFFISK